MNYKEILDKLAELEAKVARLELDARYSRERLNRLEYAALTPKPRFASGTLPESMWVNEHQFESKYEG